jgi:dephospho-CoA kinase
VVDADPAARVDRLVRDRGMSEPEARARIDAQIDDAARRAAADVVLDNNGPRAALEAAVDALWTDRLVPFERNLRAGTAAVQPARAAVVDPDPTWPAQFARLAARIRHRVAAERRIDHIGSTAVPGLPAKDVLDMQLTVDSMDEADALADRLAAAGFPVRAGIDRDNPKPPDAGPWEKRLHGNADPGRPVNLHVRVGGSPGWRTALLLRDFLRADTATREDYLALKRRLAGRPGEAYREAKEPWFDTAYAAARRWADETGWTP